MTSSASNGYPKPTIILNAGEIEPVVDQAEDALIACGRGLYQRANIIVSVGETAMMTAGAKEVRCKRIFERGDHALREDLSVAACFERYDGRAKDFRACDPPMSVVRTLKDRTGRLRLPVLAGIINAPTLRADGSILDKSGYDAATGLLFDVGSEAFPTIPIMPSRGDALAALGSLKALISTFPFVDEADRSVGLSALLTACIRPTLPTAPMHNYTAPVAASGKSKLVDLSSILATGREAGVVAQGRTEEETEKRLGSLLLAGEAVIAIDNCEQPIAGEFLCSVLTQRSVMVRVLGKSQAPELPTNVLVTATGNNMIIAGDMVRRALLCSLDPRVERPELRKFDNDPVADAKAGRPTLVVAALTILRAYVAAGRPRVVDRLGSFETWSDSVRSALIWLGCSDPVATMDKARAADPLLDELGALVTQWADVVGQAHVTVAQAIKQATSMGSWDQPVGELAHPDFREALLMVAGRNGTINSRALGRYLAKNKDRIVRGHTFREVGEQRGIVVWKLEKA